MPSTVVHVAFALLCAAGLLGDRLTGRAALAVALATVSPDLDVFTSLVVESTHRAALHNLFVPGVAALAVYSNRGQAWLRRRFGPDAVAVAWVALTAYTVAVALDLFNVESAAVLWPLHDRFFAVVGKVGYSTTAGVEFTLLQPTLDGGLLLPGASYGTVDGGYYVPSLLAPPEGSTRTLVAVNAGWELLLALAATVVAGGPVRRAAPDASRPDRSSDPFRLPGVRDRSWGWR